MKKLIVGIVDYAVGNHASVQQAFNSLGVRCRVSEKIEELRDSDMLILPGVGAFPPAMQMLQSKGLDDFIIESASKKKPILGICLGMQLLTQSSLENGNTKGLDLIPGNVVPLGSMQYHIGWNEVESAQVNLFYEETCGKLFYFNHSYVYEGPAEFVACYTYYKKKFPTVIQHENVIGVQFHPEKSQSAGYTFLNGLIRRLFYA